MILWMLTKIVFNNAALVARETIVIDEDDASSSNPPIQLYQFSIADNDNDKDNAGVLAVAEMQARFASVGCVGSVRKQDKKLPIGHKTANRS